MLTPPQIAALVKDIKKKKELQNLNDRFVHKEVLALLDKNQKRESLLQSNFNPKSPSYKSLLKEARRELRKVHGVFRSGKRKIAPLETHSSTREREEIYPELYPKIFALTGKPASILDLGCGLNPLSLPLMKLKNLNYLAYDIDEKEISQINEFFQKHNPQGQAQALDISDWHLVKDLPRADLAFLFKVVDLLDRGKGHKKSEEVIKAIPANFVVVSFSTLTLSGKPMNAPRRRWMEWLCKRLGYKYQILEFPGEIFYVIKK